MGTMCVPSKALWTSLKGCKWGYLVFSQKETGEGSPSWRRMTQRSESRKEAARPTPFLTSRTLTKIATWNIRTMHEAGRTIQVAREMKNYKIGALGLSETRWLRTGQLRLSSGEQLLYSGHTEDEGPPPTLRVRPSYWHRGLSEHSLAGNWSTPASSQPSLPPGRRTSG